MVDQVLLSASLGNAEQTVALAKEKGVGVEVMAFAFPHILDGDWRSEVQKYQQLLVDVPGKITLHGPFMDMVSGSPDPRINAVCVARYSAAIRIAAELGAEQIVLHANFIGSLHNDFYREGWHERNTHFWPPVADYAREYGVTLLLENMWEFDPTIISDLLEAVDHPNLRACIDVGHATLFTKPEYTWEYWLGTMSPWIDEIHMNNNDGILDEHHGFNWERGVLDYHLVLDQIRQVVPNADMVLEMDRVDDMRDSLAYFQLEEMA
ncbi:MAG: hypothetical protein CL607_07400 [Anaerolineaceae bacterium]|nr:hypothetical protein [Anaerolineaceae bacterium]